MNGQTGRTSLLFGEGRASCLQAEPLPVFCSFSRLFEELFRSAMIDRDGVCYFLERENIAAPQTIMLISLLKKTSRQEAG